MGSQLDISQALASFDTYLQLDPSERQLTDFIDIINTLSPTSSFSVSDLLEDILLIQLIMTMDPNIPAHAGMNTNNYTEHMANTMTTDEELKRLAMVMSPPVAHHAPTLATHMNSAHPAAGPYDHYTAKQLFMHSPSRDMSSTKHHSHNILFNSSASEYAMTHDSIPAPQFTKLEAAFNPPTTPPAEQHYFNHSSGVPNTPAPRLKQAQEAPVCYSEPLTQRVKPRMRPPPPPSPSTQAVAGSPPSGMSIGKGKGREIAPPPWLSKTPSGAGILNHPDGRMSGPFMGHGITNNKWFSSKSPSSSGLRLKTSAYLGLNHAPPPTTVGPTACPRAPSSGRESSPINLCSSSDGGNGDGYDNDHTMEGENGSGQQDEVEEDEEQSTRSSSPIEARDIVIKGGEPNMSDEDLKKLLSVSRNNQPWMMVEKGLIIVNIFGREVPQDLWPLALISLNPKRPGRLWDYLQVDIFKGQRKATAIAAACKKELIIFKDVKYLTEAAGFVLDRSMSVDDQVRSVKIALDNAREAGAPISNFATAWEVYIWLRDEVNGWYALVNERLWDHPNYRLTVHRSGKVTPPKVKEKRPREDDNQENCNGSPGPGMLTRRQRSSIDGANAASGSGTGSGPTLPVRSPSVMPAPQPTKTSITTCTSFSKLRAHTLGATTDQSRTGASTPVSTLSSSTGSAPFSDLRAPSSISSNKSLLATEIPGQILALRQAQLALDEKNSTVRNKMLEDQQKALDLDRSHRQEVASQRSAQETQKQEEQRRFERQSHFFDQCLRVASSTALPDDLVKLAHQQLRQVIEAGVCMDPTAQLQPRAPSTTQAVPRRAASVPIRMSALGPFYAAVPVDDPRSMFSPSLFSSNLPNPTTTVLSANPAMSVPLGPCPGSVAPATAPARASVSPPLIVSAAATSGGGICPVAVSASPVFGSAPLTPSAPLASSAPLAPSSGSLLYPPSGTSGVDMAHPYTTPASKRFMAPFTPNPALVSASRAHGAGTVGLGYGNPPIPGSMTPVVPGPRVSSGFAHVSPSGAPPCQVASPYSGPIHSSVPANVHFHVNANSAPSYNSPSLPSTSHLRINSAGHIWSSHSMDNNHMIIEEDESTSGDGFVHVPGGLQLYYDTTG
ncbi:hypothetical protein FRC09_019720 [Ceratobasidium sp. 395]|nr:hypothetical protein FRC09_019720 [Ceratobasidium sp. 395]